MNEIEIANPTKLWPSERPEGFDPQVGDICQVFIRKNGCSGFNTIWAEVTGIRSSHIVGRVVDGAKEVMGQTIDFSRQAIFDILMKQHGRVNTC